MPELPEVETIKNGLAPFMEGRAIEKIVLRRPDLRLPFPPNLSKKLKGTRIDHLSRRAKYLLFHFSNGKIMAIHLGMSGRIILQADMAAHSPAAHDHMLLYLTDGSGMVLNDARRFGMVYLMEADEVSTHPGFAALGPEPLSNEFSGPVLQERLKGRKTPIKVALLDQSIVAGVGNIYASEALHQSGIHPQKEAGKLTGAQYERLAAAIRDVLQRAIASGGSTLKDYRRSNGGLGYFQHSFSVYEKAGQACPVCAAGGKVKSAIRKIVQGGRASYYCPVCQKK